MPETSRIEPPPHQTQTPAQQQTQKFVMVFTATIHPLLNDKRDRTTLSYLQYETDLAQDLKERGMRNPIQVMREGDKLRCLAGETRRRAALRAFLEKVLVNILDRPLTEAEMLREQALENLLRRDFSPVELAELFTAMLAANKYSQAELARDLKVSPGTVSKVLAVSAKLPKDLQAMIGSAAEGQIRPRAAYQLSRLASHDEMRDLATRLVKGFLKVESLETEISKRLNGNGKRHRKPIGFTKDGVKGAIPADFTWDRLVELGQWLVEVGKRGPKTGVSFEAALPSLLKGA